MVDRLYLGDAFGWDTEWTAEVAISQLRADAAIDKDKCPRAQVIKNEAYRNYSNLAKILGYIPVINIIAGVGIVAITSIFQDDDEYVLCRPYNKQLWMARGVAMVFTGPFLVIVDLIKFLYDRSIATRYHRNISSFMEEFNTSHRHSSPPYLGHPVECLGVTNRDRDFITFRC